MTVFNYKSSSGPNQLDRVSDRAYVERMTQKNHTSRIAF